MKTVSASEADRSFSTLLQAVREGESFVIVVDGEPVATLGPAPPEPPDRAGALEALLARLDAQPVLNLPRVTRDEMYED